VLGLFSDFRDRLVIFVLERRRQDRPARVRAATCRRLNRDALDCSCTRASFLPIFSAVRGDIRLPFSCLLPQLRFLAAEGQRNKNHFRRRASRGLDASSSVDMSIVEVGSGVDPMLNMTPRRFGQPIKRKFSHTSRLCVRIVFAAYTPISISCVGFAFPSERSQLPVLASCWC